MRKLTLFGLLGAVLLFAYVLDRHLTEKEEVTVDSRSPATSPSLVVTLGGRQIDAGQHLSLGNKVKSPSHDDQGASSVVLVPPQKQPPKPPKRESKGPTLRPNQHLVQEGESWESIAQLRYDDPWLGNHLAQINNQSPSTRPKGGDRLDVPPADQLERRYVVRPRDTLSEIAQSCLGTMLRAKEIARLNELPGLNKISAGQTLILPRE